MGERTIQKTILVIDDMPTSMDILVQALIQANFRVLIAESGQQALRVLQQASRQQVLPDIILLDVSMPGLDGFETCRQIKATPEIAHIPVLFVTAHNESVNKVRGFDVGGTDYITKPIELVEVQARINTHLTIGHLQQKLLAQNDSLTQDLQNNIVQLQVEAASRKQAHQELEHLLAERDKLLEVVRNQSDQLSLITTNVLASQAQQRQFLLELLGEQVQEKLSRLQFHLDAAYTDLDQSTSVPNPRTIEHAETAITILRETMEQIAQLCSDLEQQAESLEPEDPLIVLSAREREVLNLIVEGKANSEIASILYLAETTIRTYRARIMNKLNAKNVYELMRIALRYLDK